MVKRIALLDEVKEYHKDNLYHVMPHNDRMWVHDILHAILEKSPKCRRDEEIVAIHQAVLLNDTAVDPVRKEHRNHKEAVSIDEVRKRILPQLTDYFKKRSKALGFVLGRPLTDDEVNENFEKAQIFAGVVREEFGHEFGDLNLYEICSRNLSEWRNLVEAAQFKYELGQKECSDNVREVPETTVYNHKIRPFRINKDPAVE